MKKFSPLTVKLIGIGFIVLLLLIGNVMIKSKLDDREYSYRQALKSIETAAGGNFISEGPYIAIPYEDEEIDDSNYKTTKRKITRYHFIHPEKLKYESDLTTERRTVGIYSSPVFKGSVKILADFKFEKTLPKNYTPANAFLVLKISDRSLQNKPVFKINDKNVDTYLSSVTGLSGLAGKINLEKGSYHFETELKIHGSTSFSVDVSASDTSLFVKSDWASPGFTRFDYLPDTRTIRKDGFEAEWSLPFAADNENHKIGFDFVDPVNVYQKLDRAVSYGFLFIIVPFIVLFMFEALAKVNLHTVHYLLSGSACVLFFLLLLALSEHLNFAASYAIGSVSSGLLVSAYIGSITKKFRFPAILASLFVLLYSYLYLSLKSEDYALLIGSIFAFVVVAVLMFFTRNGIMLHREDENSGC